MKKLSLFLVLTMLISIFAAMPVVQAADVESFVDYSGWIANAETASASAGQKWTSTSSYSDFVLEFDVKIDSFLNSAVNPKIWFTVRNSSTSASAFYVQNTTIVGEASVGDRNTANWNGAFSNGNHGMDTAGEVHTFRIFAIDKDVVLDEKVDGSWVRVGEMTNENYSSDSANGAIVISGAQANIIVSNATVYTKPDETAAFVDYSGWDATREADSVAADQNWRTSGLYSDFVIEFDVKIDSFINNATNPRIWFDVREKSSTNSSSFYVQSTAILGEAVTGDRNTSGWAGAFSNTDHGMDTAGEFHTFRIFAIGKDIVLDEKIGDIWVRVGAMTNESYSSDYTGGKFRVGGSSAYIWVSNATVYTKPVEVEAFVDYSDWDATREADSAAADQNWRTANLYSDFVIEFDVKYTALINATGNPQIWLDLREKSSTNSSSFYVTNGSILGEAVTGDRNSSKWAFTNADHSMDTADEVHTFRIFAIGKDIVLDEKINDTWVRVGAMTNESYSTDYTGGKFRVGGSNSYIWVSNATVYTKPEEVAPFVDYSALTAKESLTSLSCAADHANSTYIKYLSTNNYENFVMEYTVSITEGSDTGYGLWLNFRKNSSAALSYITYAAQFDVNQAISSTYDYLNISKEYGILGDAGTEHIMRVSAIGRKYTFEEKINGEWVRVGEYTDDVESASGQIEFSGYAPSGKTTLFTLSDIAIYELQNLTLTPGAISSAATGTQIVFTADRAVATVPETLTITDGVNSFNASAAAGSSDTEVVVTLTDALDWSTEYTIDLSGVMDAYGICAKSVSFTTPDEPNGYVVGDAVFYKADGTTVIYAVEAGTLKVKRNVTRTIDTAATKVTLVTALYKTVGDITYMIDADVTESDTLVLNTAADLWGEITVPSDGAAYSIRTFVWQDMINCNPVATPSDM